MKELKSEILRYCKKMCMSDDCDVEVCGKLTDMLKDVAEAEYYCAVTKAMEEYGEEPDDTYGYSRGRSRGRNRMGRYTSGYEMPSRNVNEIISTLRSMWLEADPELRKKMKQELTTLISDMS